VLASGDCGFNEITEAGVKLRCTARNVNGVRARPAYRGNHLVDDFVRHNGVGPVRPGIHMAMAASHITQLAEVDLKDFQFCRPQFSCQHLELDRGTFFLNPERSQNPELFRGGGQRRAAPPQGAVRTRRATVLRQVLSHAFKGHDGDTPLHTDLLHLLSHLHTMHKRGTPPDGDGHVKSFGHLFEVRALLLTILSVGIDAIGTLHGMGDGKRDQALLPGG
jgi:hypothetical protein